jgi:hypothetical protein
MVADWKIPAKDGKKAYAYNPFIPWKYVGRNLKHSNKLLNSSKLILATLCVSLPTK